MNSLEPGPLAGMEHRKGSGGKNSFEKDPDCCLQYSTAKWRVSPGQSPGGLLPSACYSAKGKWHSRR